MDRAGAGVYEQGAGPLTFLGTSVVSPHRSCSERLADEYESGMRR